jgi:hypothetical protein
MMVCYIQYYCFSGSDVTFSILKGDNYVSGDEPVPETYWFDFQIFNSGSSPEEEQY